MMNQVRFPKFIIRSLTWFIIITQVTSSAAFADIKFSSKDTLAPQLSSDATPPTGDTSRSNILKADAALLEVVCRLGDKCLIDGDKVEVATKSLQNYLPYINHIDRNRSVVLSGGVITIPVKGAFKEIKICLSYDQDAVKLLGGEFFTTQRFAIRTIGKDAGLESAEPLIGHGFTADDLTDVKITPWTTSEQFKRAVINLEDIIRNRSPSSLRDRLLTGLEKFKNGTAGRVMGIVDSHYDDTEHYYLGFGTKNAIGIPKEFFDPNDPLSAHLQETLLHELCQAVMFAPAHDKDIRADIAGHYTAMRLQGMLFWNLNDVELAAIQWMSPQELEDHPKNRFKREIILWKERHSPVPEQMWKDDWKSLLQELKSALKAPSKSYKELSDFLTICDDASVAGVRHKFPVESRYPLLRAVTLLEDKERDLLVSVLKANPRLKTLGISDTILLMLGEGDYDNWMEEQAPDLIGRNIYHVSSEIWYPGGGLGRVMQYHGEAIHKLLGPYRDQLRQVEPGYHWRKNEKGDWVPMDYRSKDVMANPIVTELEEVERFPVTVGDRTTEAIVKRGKNDLGIWVYLIYDKDGFFTHSLYNYNDDGTNPQIPTWEQFTEFMCRASLELYRRQEEKEKVIKGDKYKAPLFHGNDAQLSLVWIYALQDSYIENGVSKPYADNDIIKKTIRAFTTHTYFNREARAGKDGESRLRAMHVQDKYWNEYFKSNRGSNWENFYDLTSAGIRTAALLNKTPGRQDWSPGWVGAVAKKHMNDVKVYDEWKGLDIIAVTNGDSRARTSSIFRGILSDKSVFPDETVDLEHPTSKQLFKAHREAKKRVTLKPGQFYTSRPEPDGGVLNPDQKAVIYTGRGAREKMGRRRANCDRNIEELVKSGVQVVIYANVQNYKESRDLAEDLRKLVENLRGKNYPGKLVFAPRFNLADQRALFAAADIEVVDSDPHTEAAGFSETDGASCGAIVVAPPWPDGEGILVSQGVKLNFDIEGEGNTLIPDVEVTEDDITKGLVNEDTPLRAKIADAYLAVIKRALAMLDERFTKHMETSYRLSRVLEALPTGAEYLRQWNATAAKAANEVVTKDLKGPKAPDSNTVIQDLIRNDKMFEITVEGNGLKAYELSYVDGYRAGVTDPNRYRGPPIDLNEHFTKDEQSRLVLWLKKHKVKGQPVKFRVATYQSSLGWKDDIEHSNISHAGYRDKAIYIGQRLLKYLLKDENSKLREEVLDKDELGHLNGDFRTDEAVNRYRLDLVNEAVEKLEARDRTNSAKLDDSAFIFKDPSSPFKKVLEDKSTREVHIITAGGGGDVLGGAFTALQLRRMMGGDVKIKVFTSNLKRGDENPEGGPLRMDNIKDSFGNSITPISGAANFYRIGEGLYADTAIKDANLEEIFGYRAKVPLSEGRIVDLLRKEGIELIMADVSKSGKVLAEDYLAWQNSNDNKGHVFVVGLDMGGDIFARFPGAGKITDTHPEAAIRSPNTDGVFLDMFAEVEKDKEMRDRILVGVSALGGDGELGNTLLNYIKDYFSSGQVEAVLDNVKFITENDPQGDRYGGVIKNGLHAIESEVSGNFLKRLLAITRITPLIGRSFGKAFADTSAWGRAFSEKGRMRGFHKKEVFEAGILSEELPDGLSKGYIRNRTRQEILPWAYPVTVFLKPSAIHDRIEDSGMADAKLDWIGKNDYLINKRGYETEMSDANNVKTREFINGYLLKAAILERAWHIKERSERSNFIANELVLLKSKYRIHPDVIHDLESIRSMLSENIDDIAAGIAYKLGLKEEMSEELSSRLVAWLNDTEDRLRSSKNVSPYVYSYFAAHILDAIADFMAKLPPSSDPVKEYMDMTEKLMASIENIGKTRRGQVLSSIMAESFLPKMLQSSPDKAALILKDAALSEFIKERFGTGFDTWDSFHFIRFVLPDLISQNFSGEGYFREALSEVYEFSAWVAASGSKDPQRKDVNILIHYSIFGKVFPRAVTICPDPGSLKRFDDILRDLISKVDSGELKYSYVFPMIDFISSAISSGKAKSPEDVKDISDTLLVIINKASDSGKNISPAVRFIINAASGVDTLDGTEKFVSAMGEGILKADSYIQKTSYNGAVYDISQDTKTRVMELVRGFKGGELIKAIAAIDYTAPSGEEARERMEEEFRDVEENAFIAMSKKVKGNTPLKDIAVLQDVKSINPISDFDHEADIERKKDNYNTGLKLLMNGRCAVGCTAGFVSGIPLDYLNADFSIKIPGTDGKPRRFIEWKLYMLEHMNKLYDLKDKPIPAVIMTGFEHNDLQDLLEETGNFGYAGDVMTYHQGPTKAMDGNGEALKIDGQDYYATPGAWGFVKWLIISGKINELRSKGIKYLTHSNLNNPIEPVSPALIGYFDLKIAKTKMGEGTVPLVLAELGDYAQERGGFAYEITYADGRTERRIVHDSRLPEGAPKGTNYNLANWVLNLDGIWEKFGLDKVDFSGKDGQALRRTLAGKVSAIESESGISPVLRERVIGGKRCYINEYILDDLTLLGQWVGVNVNRDRHFVSLKNPEDIYDYQRAQVMSYVMRDIDINIFRRDNPIVDYLVSKGVISTLQDETVESLRGRIIKLFLPSRVFKEDATLIKNIGQKYAPGGYVQGDIAAEGEAEHNRKYRESLIRTEIDLLCRAYPEKAGMKDAFIEEAGKVMEKVLDMQYDEKHKLIDVITNPESNLLVRRCIRLAFFGTLDMNESDGTDYNPYAVINAASNDIVVRRISEKGSGMGSKDLILESVAAIRLKQYFQDNDNRIGDLNGAYDKIFSNIEAEKAANQFEPVSLENMDRFLADIGKGKKAVAYITDDNGEVVYHLYFMQRYLLNNPELTITLIPRSRQNGIDASFDDILQVLSYPIFSGLRDLYKAKRLKIVKDSTRMGGIDLLRASPETKEALSNCDFIISVGLVNHESIYNYIKPAYHLLKVHGQTSALVTGHGEGTYLFLHNEAGATLRDPFAGYDETLAISPDVALPPIEVPPVSVHGAVLKSQNVPNAYSKGSVKGSLEAIYNSDLRLKAQDTHYSLGAVQEKVRLLKALGILVDGTLPDTYKLKSQIRNLSPPEFKKILSIPELDLATIPQDKIPALRKQIEKLVLDIYEDRSRKTQEPVTIAVTLNNEKVGAGMVNAKGELLATAPDINWREVYGDNVTSLDIESAILSQVMSFVRDGGLDANSISGVGIAFNGPIDEDTGTIGTPFGTPNSIFKNYPIKSKLEAFLKSRFKRDVAVTVYNESKAALLGEMSPEGSLAGKSSGGVVMLGTGLNMVVAKDGKYYPGVSNEGRELGHYLVANYVNGGWHYHFPAFESEAVEDIQESIDSIKVEPDRSTGAYKMSDGIKFMRYGQKFDTEEITRRAQDGDELALKFIAKVGEEMGRGIAQFQYDNKNEPFIYNLVLASAGLEEFGKGAMRLPEGSTNKFDGDCFMSSLQNSVFENLVRMGMNEPDAERAARGIVRSKMTYERELVAFTPISTIIPDKVSILEAARINIKRAADIMGLHKIFLEGDRSMSLAGLLNPQRTISVEIPVRMDNGTTKIFHGFRVLHNDSRGPAKGGFRFDKNEVLAETSEGLEAAQNKAGGLGNLMTVKTAVIGIPYGGAKGDVIIGRDKYSEGELEQATRGFVKGLLDKNASAVGPLIDIPAPDMNTGPEEMTWFYEEYVKWLREKGIPITGIEKGVVTGKPVSQGGSLGRTSATGRGVFFAAREFVAKRGDKYLSTGRKDLKGSTVVVQGYGNVGLFAAHYFNDKAVGSKVVAVSNEFGGIYNASGIDLKELDLWVESEKARIETETGKKPRNVDLSGFRDVAKITNKELLELDVDILAPCALESQITAENAARIRARVIVEGANNPTSPAADKILKGKGTAVIPDVLANAGGVTVSYYEWIQNLTFEQWTEVAVDKMLEQRMKVEISRIIVVSEKFGITMREAAFLIANARVANAELARNEKLQEYFKKSGEKPYEFYGNLELNPETVEDLGYIIKKNELSGLIERCEADMQKKIEEIADSAAEKFAVSISGPKALLIAGPATAGKTAVQKRIGWLLEQRGHKVKYLDSDLNSKALERLMNGESVNVIDKADGKIVSSTIKLERDDVLIVEGSRAMKESNLKCIPQENKFSVFVNVAPSMKLGDNWPFTSLEERLMRDILDNKKRSGRSVTDTVKSWLAIRKKQIERTYAQWNDADATLNTDLPYEILVMKTYLEDDLIKARDGELRNSGESLRIVNKLLQLLSGVPKVSREQLSSIPRSSVMSQILPDKTFLPEYKMVRAVSAETSSSDILRDTDAIHDINMGLLPPVENGKVFYQIIEKELIPVTMISQMEKFARETENLKLRERTKIVERKDLQSETAKLKEDSNNIVLSAVQYKEDLALLPDGVKALVFTGADGGAFGFKQLESIQAALRALYRGDAATLARLYGMLSGTPFTGKESDILKYIDDPKTLAGIIVFNLEPSVAKDTEELEALNRHLLECLYKA